MVMAIVTIIKMASILMSDRQCCISPLALLRQQSWLSPAFPIGSYSYSHAVEWAVEAGRISDRQSLVDWLEADLRYGTGRNEAIFFIEASRCATEHDYEKLIEIAEMAAAFRSTSEFALESSQQALSCSATLRKVWPDHVVEWLSKLLAERDIPPVLAVIVGAGSARQHIPSALALPAFLHSYVANLVIAGIRLIPLGQTDGQFAIAELERAVLTASAQAEEATIHDLGSAGFMVDIASAWHEIQYTRLFRS